MKKTLLKLICLLTFAILTKQIKAQESDDTLTATVAKNYFDLEALKKIKITGYIQPQFQWADSAGEPSFGGGNFASGVDKRFQLRESRLKVTYENNLTQGVFQVDVSEKGVAIKDMYVKILDPWTKWFSLKAGMFDRPFGFEIGYSSSLRESPDRARMSQILFPGERDLGAALIIQGKKGGSWEWIKFEGGMFNGTGAPGPGINASDFDKFKDFIGHLSINRSTASEKFKYGLGISYYDGGFRQDQVNSYKYGADSLGVKGFIIDVKKADVASSVAARKPIKRNYVGFDAQISFDWLPGITTLRGEYIQGKQPGTAGTTTSPSAPFTTTVNNTFVVKDTSGNYQTITTSSTIVSDLYSRNFNGAYFYFLQNLMQTPLQLIVKYDWYDPNTDVKGDEIGKATKSSNTAKTGAADIKFSTLGLGLAYRWDANIKFTAYYDMVKNETSANLPGYTKDLHDNLFTLRMQIKF